LGLHEKPAHGFVSASIEQSHHRILARSFFTVSSPLP
jgi:hypothetical protein